MTEPGSELSTLQWLRERSGLEELIGFDFSNLSIMSLYRVSDRLYNHKERLEMFLYSSEKKLFEFDDVITLYDLTNTYFEGSAKRNKNARLGHSKEKRSDCPLVTLALVLDGSGFPKKSEIFEGNVSEPKTLAEMLGKLSEKKGRHAPTVVLDAGIATEKNVSWLQNSHYKYVVVSRKRHREFNQAEAVSIKDDGEQNIQAQRVVNADTGEVELYCQSSQRKKKEQAISELFTQRFEAALSKLEQGLREKGKVKNYEKVLERIGRIKQEYARVAKYYLVTVKHDENTNKAIAIEWKRSKRKESELPGVYCLRTNQIEWDEKTLWHVYTMLTDLEAVFRSLKSELGLRPVFHHKTDRVSGHLFISVLAYHCVHSVRFQLKNCDIHLSWEGLRRQLKGQERTTVELKRADGKTLHVRKASRPEPRQQLIYDALGLSDRPGKTEKALIS